MGRASKGVSVMGLSGQMVGEVDAHAIHREVRETVHALTITEEPWTPSGRRRTSPLYEGTLTNAFDGYDVVLTGRTQSEVHVKAAVQRQKWCAAELKKRLTAAARDLSETLEDACRRYNEAIEALHAALTNILPDGLAGNCAIPWADLLDRTTFPPFRYEPNRPVPPIVDRPGRIGAALERVAPVLARRRRSQEAALTAAWVASTDEWELLRRGAVERWRKAHAEHESARLEQSQVVADLRERFTRGEPTAMAEAAPLGLARLRMPEGFGLDFSCGLDVPASTVIVDVELPLPTALPHTVRKDVKPGTTTVIDTVLKEQDHSALYEEAVLQSLLLVLRATLDITPPAHVGAAVVNGWVTYVDRADGQDKRVCVASVSAAREQMHGIRLDRVDPMECFRGLAGRTAGPVVAAAPVRPIMYLKTTDDRFIDEVDVLGGLAIGTNLADMPWQEFEHLVRQWLAHEFSTSGGEVKVTKASRDGGVDAVVFDPDPLRGGKIVVQAKRYNNVVPVGAVRELFGVVTAERAARGILVTTAHFGRDAHLFVKDKAITLVDGPTLVDALRRMGGNFRVIIGGRQGGAE